MTGRGRQAGQTQTPLLVTQRTLWTETSRETLWLSGPGLISKNAWDQIPIRLEACFHPSDPGWGSRSRWAGGRALLVQEGPPPAWIHPAARSPATKVPALSRITAPLLTTPPQRLSLPGAPWWLSGARICCCHCCGSGLIAGQGGLPHDTGEAKQTTKARADSRHLRSLNQLR